MQINNLANPLITPSPSIGIHFLILLPRASDVMKSSHCRGTLIINFLN